MDCIKSRIKGSSIFLFSFMFVLPFWGFPFGLFKIFYNIFTGVKIFGIGGFLIILFLVFIYTIVIQFLNGIKYIIIKENKLKYFSLFVPFGKTLNFSDYIGKIMTTETGSGGSYKVVYLVDKNRRTVLKIMGLHYKNFDEMNNAIPLKKISYSPSGWQYFKLLIFERITIVDKQLKGKEKGGGEAIAKIFAVISIIGLTLFVIGMLVKILSKIIGKF